MTPKRPILRYHGGKWKLADWIISHFPKHRIYVEPFGGAASVLLKKPRSYAEVYNDLDGELVNLFRVTRSQGLELKQALLKTPFARQEFIESYEPIDDPLEQARRTVIRSYMGFGSNSHFKKSGFRANSNRSGTTPAHDWANYPAALEAIIERLQGVVIENKNALDVMIAHDGFETLHYVDPPYMPETRTGSKGYRHEMSEDEHLNLLEFLEALDGYVIVSGYRSPMYDEFFNHWQRVDKTALADGARPRVECLWLSPNCDSRDLFSGDRQ